MVAESSFPYESEDLNVEGTPRVGDGAILVDGDGRIEFATPNAVNALHRLGVYSPPDGSLITSMGIDMGFVTESLEARRPLVNEVERRPEVVVLFECLPLLAGGQATGALILLRDVTDVRRLNLLVLSKDAAIREVHHRVKNNLQTISALLRLQSRRLQGGQGRDALLEAERRVRSIALVHEILSREPGDQVPFGELVGPLVKMAEDSVVVSRPIEITYSGDLGETTADVATPLAVAIAELLQNAVEHAFSGEETDRLGHVFLRLAHDEKELVVEVRDDGQGLPEEFELDSTQSLGLSLVRDLVRSQLAGEISMVDVDIADGGGTKVTIAIPRAVDAAR